MINVAIVDDNIQDVNRFKSYIEEFEKESNYSFHLDTFQNGIGFLDGFKSNYDFIILDIDMPFMNGLDVARRLREKDAFVPIVFISSLKQFVIKGYEVNAMDYIIKPIDYVNFVSKIKKAISISQKFIETKVKIKVGSEYRVIDVMDILYVEVRGSNLFVVTSEGSYKTKGPLYVIAETLGTTHFAMCNSCYLVNMNYVDKFDKTTLTVGGHELQFSRNKRKDFLERLDIYLGTLR